jgi:DNA-binding HxlR family transcriptional regulator
MSELKQAMPGLPARGDVYNPKCPTRLVLNHITGRWGCLVLASLLDGTRRFAEIRRHVTGISEKMLAQTLRDFERDGLVVRRSFPVVPPHVEYSLTPLGRGCADRLWTLATYLEDRLHLIVAQSGQAEGL